MNYDFVKAQPITLREAGKDEKWLQELIAKDPAILGLGEVELIQRERIQPTGGRIDLILADSDPEENLHYEVEVMLGTVDESHIIRTIEYWDVERRRYPKYQHRAVIVAEEINNRFFNVISLLNRAIPIVAIQLNAFVIQDKLTLNFVKVLDIVEEEDDDAGEQVSRGDLEKLGKSPALAVMDAIMALKGKAELRVKYNRGHIAVGTTGTNFAWFMLRKGDRVFVEMAPGDTVRPQYLERLTAQGIECRPHRDPHTIKMSLQMSDVKANQDLLRDILVDAEKLSRE